MTDQNQRISSGVRGRGGHSINGHSGLSAGGSPQSEADEKSGSGLHLGGGLKLRYRVAVDPRHSSKTVYLEASAAMSAPDLVPVLSSRTYGTPFAFKTTAACPSSLRS